MLGVHFAITAEQERLLLAAADVGDAEVADVVEEIEENWTDRSLSVHTDKAWDAMHRCLGDGSLDQDGPDYPLSHAVLGGEELCVPVENYVCYVTASEVRDVAVELHRIDRTWLRQRFDALTDDYDGPRDDADFAYTWENFVEVRAFYDRAAEARRAVIFTT